MSDQAIRYEHLGFRLYLSQERDGLLRIEAVILDPEQPNKALQGAIHLHQSDFPTLLSFLRRFEAK